MKKIGGLTVVLVLGAIVLLAVRWAHQPYEVHNPHGLCMHEVHPSFFGEDKRMECGTTGELGLAPPVIMPKEATGGRSL